MNKWIFKILRPSELIAAQNNAFFPGAPIDISDGFVHFSTAVQVQETANKHFTDIDTIHILAFKSETWTDTELKWEISRGNALFPHLYATLDISLNDKTWTITRSQNGMFDLTDIEKWADKND